MAHKEHYCNKAYTYRPRLAFLIKRCHHRREKGLYYEVLVFKTCAAVVVAAAAHFWHSSGFFSSEKQTIPQLDTRYCIIVKILPSHQTA
jgi:hypothetical protein